MKILITGLNFTPELIGIGKYTGEMVEWLAAKGHEVRVVCAPPYYPAWRVGPGHSRFRYRTEAGPRVRVIRCPLYVPKRPSGARRLLHLISFAVTSGPVVLYQALTFRPDVVFTVEPPLLSAPIAALAGRLVGARRWLHVQDLEVDAAFDLGLLRSSFLRRVALALERFILRRFDRVTTISEAMRMRLIEKGIPDDRSGVFRNWADFHRIRPISGVSGFRQELAIPDDAVVVLYSGTFAAKQGLDLLPEVLDRIGEAAPVVLVLVGDGPAKASLVAATAGRTNVRMLPLQPLERLNELMNLADIHVLPQRADAEDRVLPSKLTTMLASGRCVVACASPGSEVARVLDGVARTVLPGDGRALASVVMELSSNPGLRSELGRLGRDRAFALWEREAVLAEAFGFVAGSGAAGSTA